MLGFKNKQTKSSLREAKIVTETIWKAFTELPHWNQMDVILNYNTVSAAINSVVNKCNNAYSLDNKS